MAQLPLLVRLRSRASFGPRPYETTLAGAEPAGEDWLEAQLRPERIDDARLRGRLAANDDLKLIAPGEMEMPRRKELGDRDARRTFRRQMRHQALALAGQRVVRTVESPRELEEVMVDFWFNHFNVFARKGPIPALLPAYEDSIRRHAFGRFEDLLLATARSPAMLLYLDNARSSRERRFARNGRGGLNENYARELLELHTLGVKGGYTQADVVETARVLTGWSVDRDEGGVFRFRSFLHDSGPKRVLGRRVPGDGEDEGLWLLRQLARHPSTATHVSTKLCRKFLSDDPPTAAVARTARAFLDSEGDLRVVLRSVLLSPEFTDPGQRKLKTPLEFVASGLRAAGGTTDGGKGVLFVLHQLGEPPLHCSPPTGYPDVADAWLDAGAMLERMSFAYGLAANRVPGTGFADESGSPAALARHLASPEFQYQ